MQNSGLGVSLNALASLHLPYRIPCLLLVTWRGFEGRDAPEHLIMGEKTGGLLDLFGITYRVPTAAGLLDDVRWAAERIRATTLPTALVVRPGLFA